jgi:hypothetical protein
MRGMVGHELPRRRSLRRQLCPYQRTRILPASAVETRRLRTGASIPV